MHVFYTALAAVLYCICILYCEPNLTTNIFLSTVGVTCERLHGLVGLLSLHPSVSVVTFSFLFLAFWFQVVD